MARFYAHPFSATLTRTLLITYLLVFIAGITAYAQNPTISDFNPKNGPVGTEVTITGSGFTTANMVYIGSESTLDFVVDNDNQIRVNVPASASTGKIQVHISTGAGSSSATYTLTDAPAITSIDPVTGPVGTEVTITGSKFTGVTSLSLAGGSVDNYVIVSDTEIKATVSASAYSGVARVTANHGSANGSQSFTVTGTPTVTGFSPTSGPVGTVVTITGTGFDNISSVIVAGATASNFTRVSSTEIKATVSSTAAGGSMRVTTAAGTAIGTGGSFNVTGTPTITSFSPASAPVGSEVTINGTGFTNANTVYIGSGSITDFIIVSDTQIKAIVPNTASTGRIQVYTSQGKVVSSYNFAVEGAPVISSFSPKTGSVGTLVTIKGRNFNTASTVYIGSGSTTNFNIISDTEIQILVPFVASSGIVRVYANSGRGLSSGTFTLENGPEIISFSPQSGPVGTEITVIGKNFTGTNIVYIGSGSTTNFSVISDTELKVTVPATATSGKILIRTATGQIYSTDIFSLTGAPEIHSFTPGSGPVGTTVTITGINFTGATLVYFGSGTTNTFTVLSDTEIQVIVPALASTGKIQVHTPNGRAYSALNFTVSGAPEIISFSPQSGPVGTEITVIGKNFTGTNIVYIGSGSTTNFSVISDTELKVTVPATATSGKILIRTATGQIYSTDIFSLTGAPEIHSFTPGSGPVGTTVTITGINFTGATLVYFGSGTTNTFTVLSDTEIQVIVPALASTGKIQVHTPNGRAYSALNFTVSGAPELISFSPQSGPVGTEITVTGKNFTGTNRVYVGSGSTTNGYTVISDTELKVTVFSNATDGRLIIRTPNGQVSSVASYDVTPAYLTTSEAEYIFNNTAIGVTQNTEYTVEGLGLANGQPVTITLNQNSPYTISLSAGGPFVKSLTISTVSNNRLTSTPVYVQYIAASSSDGADDIIHTQGSVESRMQVRVAEPMPVELTSFSATLKDGMVKLNWATASEQNNSHFEIEMASGTATNFKRVGIVESKAGNSSTTLTYSYSNYYSSQGQAEYYRLKQVDYDGTPSYSRTVAVRPVISTKEMEVAPNPITASSHIYFNADQAGKAVIRVTSITGKQMYFEQVDAHIGENAIRLAKYEYLTPGIYIITVEHNGKQESVRVEKR